MRQLSNAFWVVVTTRCEGYVVELVYEVHAPDSRPAITCRVVEEEIDFRGRRLSPG